MQSSQWEIVILKPTRVFLSFLTSQLPNIELPEFRPLKMDNTAYIIAKHNNDEDTFNEIENNFTTMFKHEIHRWIGEKARNPIEGTFLDFLCCFKFELHSKVILMEPSLAQGRQLLRIKPRAILLKWLKSAVEERIDFIDILNQINLSHLAENATVVIKNFNDSADIEPFLKDHYYSLFEAEMSRMCDKAEEWPMVNSYPTFKRYFSIETHTQLVHLV